MMKNQTLDFPNQNMVHLGEINITTGVLESIATKATSEIEGVLVNASKSESNRFMRFERFGIHAKMSEFSEHIVIDVSVRVKYGYSVPKVALEIQERIKEEILFMTDLVVNQVNVHVIAVEADNPTIEIPTTFED